MKALGRILVGLTFISSIAFGATISVRPTPGRGPVAKTLVVYSQARESYSLLNSLELLRLQLGRFACAVETVPIFEVTPEQFGQCDYLVVLALDAREAFPTNTIAAIASARCPVLWLGLGLEPVRQIDLFRGQIEIGGESQIQSSHVITYRARRWDVGEFGFREIKLPVDSASRVLLSAETGEAGTPSHPMAWTYKNFTFFAAEPQEGAAGFIFEDLLFDFFGVQDVAANACLLRISNYRPNSNHREFKRMADFLHSHSIPMAVSISGFNGAKDSESVGEFFSSLRYAQQRGARVVIRGTGDFEFWDGEADGPQMRITGGGIQAGIIATAEAALRNGLLPIAWETPHNAASSYCYGQIAGIFGTAIERVQLSDATSRHNYAPAGLALDRFGRLLVPENLAFGAGTTNAMVDLKARADLLAALKGSILGVSFDAYHPLSDLVQLVDLLESYHLPFLDLADLGNRVSLPGRVLLTGNASASVLLHNATVRWKTFSRGGQLLAEDEQRTKLSGERQFKRIGIGTYELVQFTNDNGSTR